MPLIALPKSCSCRWGPCPPHPSLVWVCLFSFFLSLECTGRLGPSALEFGRAGSENFDDALASLTANWALARRGGALQGLCTAGAEREVTARYDDVCRRAV